MLDLTRQQEHTSHTEWALMAKAVLDRTRLCLASKAESLSHLLQPSAEYLGQKLGVPSYAVRRNAPVPAAWACPASVSSQAVLERQVYAALGWSGMGH